MRGVLENIARKEPYAAISADYVRDLRSGDIEFPIWPGLSVVLVPGGEEEETFSLTFVGDLATLD